MLNILFTLAFISFPFIVGLLVLRSEHEDWYDQDGK